MSLKNVAADINERTAADYSEIWQLTAGHPIIRQTAIKVTEYAAATPEP